MVEKQKIDIQGANEIVWSFDSTGSMASVIAQVRSKIEETVEQLLQDIPGVKIGMISHGDYCDGDRVIDILKLTDDKNKIYKFIRNTPNTGGGDAPEAYELALHEARSMGWTDGVDSGRALVLIGDDEPHTPDYAGNTKKLDWANEVIALREIGVKVYPLQCLYSPHRQTVNQFWSQIAELSGSTLLKLQDFNESAHNLMGVAYAAAGEDAYAMYEARAVASAAHFTSETACNTAALREEAKKFTAARHLK